MISDELRSAFLSFFESKGHKIIPSSSLIPQGDPTLLLTSAGMVQIKPYFMGEAIPPSPRLASCQKCFRTTDIEAVGDATHLTFFEMLGNFSVGDYFKPEAISWAWEFVTRRLAIPEKRLWISVFLDDDESFRYWRQIGVPEGKILRFGEEDNFWGPAGDSGPCGPCSEIYYDVGENVGCQRPSCAPGCDCGRFSEIWNRVFTQYYQDKEGNRTPLPRPNIDTGMGLERTTAALQGKTSVYGTDLFVPLLEGISRLTGRKYGEANDIDNAMRVITEHGRGITFLIGDGVMPDNEGRGYVLRRLLRRAALFGRRLGLEELFLSEIARATIKQMKHVYPEIEQRQNFILKVIEQEEARFSETLTVGLEVNTGLLDYREEHRGAIKDLQSYFLKFKPAPENAGKILEQHGFVGSEWETGRQVGAEMAAETISQLTYDFLGKATAEGWQRGKTTKEMMKAIERWGQNVSDKEAFKLYDTYGFPVELTREIAAQRGFTVDLVGFEREMEKQKERAKATHKFELAEKVTVGLNNELDIKSTSFVGYRDLKQDTTVVGILAGKDTIGTLKEGQEAGLILKSTPFYGEMGGQVGDTGEIRGTRGRFTVTDTVRVPPGIIVHQGRVTEGSLSVGDSVEAKVDRERRLDIARNHTATHLLQAALRQVLGEHVQQRGSVVAPERFSFDFSHLAAVTPEEIREVQHLVNERIRQNLAVYDEELPYKKAVAEGAIALFDEKYGDVVRVLKIGSPSVSTELCGGTHVTSTGEIGFFLVLGEHSIGAGLRRIEGLTGRQAESYITQRFSEMERMAEYLETKPDNVPNRVESLSNELKEERKKRQALEKEKSRDKAREMRQEKKTVVHGIEVLHRRVDDYISLDTLREMSDSVIDNQKREVVVLGTVSISGTAFVANVAPSLVDEGIKASDIVNFVAQVTGGSGGGKAKIAQGGGKDKSKLDEALSKVPEYLEEHYFRKE